MYFIHSQGMGLAEEERWSEGGNYDFTLIHVNFT